LTLVAVSGGGAEDARADRVLAQALQQVRAVVPNARKERLHGKTHLQIIEAAAQLGADLIVVGRHGDGGFARAWVGGVAQKVIGLAECPVLVAIASSKTTETSS
jgi:nucleotide-binding universal stress UspA family protein